MKKRALHQFELIVPTELIEIQNHLWGVVRLLKWERNRRRAVEKDLRVNPPEGLVNVADLGHDILPIYLLAPERRFLVFWHGVEHVLGRSSKRDEEARYRSPEFLLLERWDSRLVWRMQERSKSASPQESNSKLSMAAAPFRGEVTVFPEVLQTEFEEVQRQLGRWESLDSPQQAALASAVWALASVTRDDSVLEGALEKCSDLGDYFSPVPEALKSVAEVDIWVEAAADVDATPASHPVEDFGTKPAAIALDEEWASLCREMRDKAQRGLEIGPSSGVLEAICELLPRFEALHPLVTARDSPTQRFTKALEHFRVSAMPFLEGQQEGLLGTSVLEQITARWQRAAIGEDGAVRADIFDDLERAAGEVGRLSVALAEKNAELLAVEQQVGGLETKRGQVTRVKERRDLDNELLGLKEAVLRHRRELNDLEQQWVDAASPWCERFDWDVDYCEGASGSADPLREIGVAKEAVPTGEAPAAQPTPPSVEAKAADVVPVTIEDSDREESVETDPGAAAGATPTPQPAIYEVSATLEEPPLSDGLARPGDEPDDSEPRVVEPFGPAAGEKCRPIWTALRHGEVSLAYQIARSLKSLEGDIEVPEPTLIKAVALSMAVQSPDGALGRELRDAFGELNRDYFEDGPEEWLLANNLLLLAATVRANAVAPTSGGAGVFSYVKGVPEALYQLGKLLAEAGQRLHGLSVASAFVMTSDQVTWERNKKSLLDDVQSWETRAASVTVKYQAGTVAWQRLCRSGGAVGRVLELIRSESHDRQAFAELVRQLRDRDEFDRLVQQADRRTGPRERIHAGALNQLLQRAAEVAELAERWIEIVDTEPEKAGYVAGEARRLRGEFGLVVPAASRELEDLRSSDDSRWGLVSAAASVVGRSMVALGDLLKGARQAGEAEREVGEVLCRGLMRAPEIDIGAGWTVEAGLTQIVDAATRLLAENPSWAGALHSRAQGWDFLNARRILDCVPKEAFGAESDPEALVAREEQAAKTKLGQSIREARDLLETAFAYGGISEADRSSHAGRLQELEAETERGGLLRGIARGVDQVRAAIKASQDDQLREVRSRLDKLRSSAEPTGIERVEQALATGDLLTANEYLQRLEEGADLPEPAAPYRDTFREFFPLLATDLEKYMTERDPSVQDLVRSAREGKGFAGLSFEGVSRPQRDSAQAMLEAWFKLKRGQRGDAVLLKSLLGNLGFEVEDCRLEKEAGGRAEYQLDCREIVNRSICALPRYGSQARGRYRVLCVWGRPVDEDLFAQVGETIANRPEIVLYFGRLKEKRRRELARGSRERQRKFLVLDEILLLFLCAERGSRLGAFFHCALPFTHVDPFVTTSGLVPPELFYGRLEELNAVREPNGRCFIYGGRQLGKTALLREAERTFHAPERQRFAKWIDLKTAGIGSNRELGDLWTLLAQELAGVLEAEDRSLTAVGSKREPAPLVLDFVKNWCIEKPERRLLLLLDEADRFLEVDGRSEFRETTRLKNLMEVTRGQFKVVFAGLHNVLRTVVQRNHPLAHLGDPIEIGPLLGREWKEAHALIEEPLREAGYEFESPQLVTRILAHTNYYPSLIQLFGNQLVSQFAASSFWRGSGGLAGPRYRLTNKAVEDAFKAKALKDAIRSRFEFTLQLDPRYEVVAYAIAYAVRSKRASISEGLPPEEVFEEARGWWGDGFVGTGEAEFKVLLDEMVGLGVLRHIESGRFGLRNPNTLLLMGNESEIEARLLKEREAAQEFEPDVYRALENTKGQSARRSPLTFSQEWEVRRNGSGVVVVLGCEAAGIDEVTGFLRGQIGSDKISVLEKSSLVSFRRWLDDELERRIEGETVVLVIPEVIAWNTEWIDYACHKVGRLRAAKKVARVVFLADAASARDLLPTMQQEDRRDVEFIWLKPWADTFLKQWLEDIGVGGVEKADRLALADVSGMWPTLLIRAATGVKHRFSEFEANVRTLVEDPRYREELRRKLGLNLGNAPFLRVVAQVGDIAEEEIADYADAESLDPEAMRGWLDWAEHLQIAVRSGARVWRLNKLAADLLLNS
jgi:hypothetical protein